MSDVTPEHEQVIALVGHVFHIESSLGIIEPVDKSADSPGVEVVFLTFRGTDSDGNEFVHHFTLNVSMCQQLAAAAATGSLVLTERLTERVVARRMQAQETRRRREDHGYM